MRNVKKVFVLIFINDSYDSYLFHVDFSFVFLDNKMENIILNNNVR